MLQSFAIDRPTGGPAIVVTLSDTFDAERHKPALIERLRREQQAGFGRNYLIFDASKLRFLDSRLIRHVMIDAALLLASDKLVIVNERPNDPELEFLQHLPLSDAVTVFQNIVDALVYVHVETTT